MAEQEEEDNGPKIVVSRNGPYVVRGNVPLPIQVIVPNEEGFAWEWKEAKEFETPTLSAAAVIPATSPSATEAIKFRDGLFQDAK